MDVTFTAAPALPAWLEAELPYRRRMAVIGGRRMHFVDEGEGRPVLLIHGNPTWCFLWRKVLARLASAGGFRLVAPDLLGLGLSDKPKRAAEHTLEAHVGALKALVEALDLKNVILVGQDWGGPIGAGVAARAPERFTAAVFGNTSLLAPRRPLRPAAFHRLSHVPLVSELLFRGLGFPLQILGRAQGDPRSIGPLERRAYAYPLSSWADRVAPLALARMVPNREDHPSLSVLDETDRWVRSFRGPAALVWGLKDPILGRALRRLREALPMARVVETQAGHFLQEEVPDELASAIRDVAGR